MTLTLVIQNAAALENGMPSEFVLHERGATIGRASTCDWCLPDPQRHISSRHAEITYRDGGYWLKDVSTNGTFLNDSNERMQDEHMIGHGDAILIGEYEIVAELSGLEAAPDESDAVSEEPFSGWSSWADNPDSRSAAGDEDQWGEPQELPAAARPLDRPAPNSPTPAHEIAGPSASAPMRGFEWGERRPAEEVPAADADSWAPSHSASDIPDAASVWQAPEAQPDASSGWSSAAPDRPAPASPADIWGQLAENNVVDWARGGFGSPVQPDADPLGLAEPESITSEPLRESTSPPATAATAPSRPRARQRAQPKGPPQSPPPAVPRAPDSNRAIAEFLGAAGLAAGDLKGPPDQAVARAGLLLRRLIAGLVILVEARARAKSQMGAETTRLEFDGNNPIKFARSPEQALAQLLSPPERGFMTAERAVEDAFYDLQSHQMATLKAMQGALRATLDRFSPEAIRKRADTRGFLASILPASKDAALWRTYEREFSGVASGSDEAFMDVFAKEFRKAYEEQSRLRDQSPPR